MHLHARLLGHAQLRDRFFDRIHGHHRGRRTGEQHEVSVHCRRRVRVVDDEDVEGLAVIVWHLERRRCVKCDPDQPIPEVLNASFPNGNRTTKQDAEGRQFPCRQRLGIPVGTEAFRLRDRKGVQWTVRCAVSPVRRATHDRKRTRCKRTQRQRDREREPPGIIPVAVQEEQQSNPAMRAAGRSTIRWCSEAQGLQWIIAHHCR
eukprot:3454855-Prymnesium_polylepis.1